jgi:glycosyltransferase involved in cell wall biosynthesis
MPSSLDLSSARLDLCLASPTFHPAYSGPAIRFKRYAPGLRERGVDMRVFAADRNRKLLRGSFRFTSEVVDGIPVDRVPVKATWRTTRLAWRFERALLHYCQSSPTPDVVQLLNLWDTSSPFWLRRLRSLGVPIVYTHTMMRDPRVGRFKNRIWLRPFREVDCTVVSTAAMQDSLRRTGFGGPIRIIPNGVDTNKFRPPSSAAERKALRLRLDIPPDAEVIMFVGGYLIHRKGVDLLADAWASVASKRPLAHLLLVGPTYNSLRPEGPQTSFLDGVKKSLEASGAIDRVLFTGPVENVEDYLQAADVFVFPSRREGMPNVVLEAYATAVPSVLCPFTGMSREFGIPGDHYLSARHDATEIAERVLELLASESLRTGLGTKARDWVLTAFRTESSLDAYSDLYRELTTGRRNVNPGSEFGGSA